MAKSYLIYCKEDCPQCDGAGFIDMTDQHNDGLVHEERCFECRGKGELRYEVSLAEALRNIQAGCAHG